MDTEKKTLFSSKDGKYDLLSLIYICVAVLSVMISFFLIPYHEIWRDEGQAWLIARDTPLKDLFGVLKHEGHPALWFLILMPFAKAGLPVICLNYISWAINAVSVFVVATKAPFHPVLKISLLLSPMYVYWFPVVSRSYSALNCLLVLLALIYTQRRKKPVLYGLLLFGLANMHLIIAGVVGGVLLVDVIEIFKEYRKNRSAISWKAYSGTFIGIIGCILMVLQLMGSPDVGSWNIGILDDKELLIYRLFYTMRMIFPPATHYYLLFAVLALFFIVFTLYLIYKKFFGEMMILLFEVGFLGYILLFIMPSGQKSYFLLSTAVFVLWITKTASEKTEKKDHPLLSHRNIQIFLAGLFVLSIIGGYTNTIIDDIREPFTTGKLAAEYLNQNYKGTEKVIFVDSAYEPSVTAYLNPDIPVWDIAEGDYRSFPLWSADRTNANYLYHWIYSTVIDQNAAMGIEGYTGTAMGDFMQNYIDQCFPAGTEVYLVLTKESADLYDLEAGSGNYVFLNRFYADCPYSAEGFSIYYFVSKG